MALSFNDMNFKTILSLLIILVFPTLVFGDCTCDYEAIGQKNGKVLKLKIGAIASILLAGALGVSLPILGKKIPTLRPENDIFFMIKAFAAGVILATGFIHILPDAFDDLTSPCLDENPWGKFPFTGFVAMMSAIATLMIDSFATGYYKRLLSRGANKQVSVDEETAGDGDAGHHGHHHAHAHASHGHGHGHHDHGSSSSSSSQVQLSTPELIRHRIVAQVRFNVYIIYMRNYYMFIDLIFCLIILQSLDKILKIMT